MKSVLPRIRRHNRLRISRPINALVDTNGCRRIEYRNTRMSTFTRKLVF